jgi:hypothetical protein
VFGELSVRGVHFAELDRRRGVESITRPEEVSMHPMMIMAVGRQVERERQCDQRKSQLGSRAFANRLQDAGGSPAASGLTRRLLAGRSLRPGLS